MPSARMVLWNREKKVLSQKSYMPFIVRVVLPVVTMIFLLLLLLPIMPLSICHNEQTSFFFRTYSQKSITVKNVYGMSKFDCMKCPQAAPVVANKVEGVQHPFFISLADLGSPEKPNRNFLRLLKGKAFRKPDISETIQSVLGQLESEGAASKQEVVVDVGANVGMAAFAAAAMGYKVLAFEAVFENLQRLCDGLYFNRAGGLVSLFHAAVSDVPGNLTMHKVVGRLDNSAVSATGAKLAFKSNEILPVTVPAVALDDLIPDSEPVVLLKIDVQGWEYHVLKGASNLLSRKPGYAPYIIYEDDEKLLKESNTSSKDIQDYLVSMGYNSCSRHGTDSHCKKKRS